MISKRVVQIFAGFAPARWGCNVAPVVVALLALANWTSVANAQPSFTESVYVVPGAEDTEDGRAEIACGREIRQPLLQSGGFIERVTPEISSIVSGCVEDVASAGQLQDCDLASANVQVDYLIFVEALASAEGWRFDVTVHSPNLAATVWAADVTGAGTSGQAAAREVCEEVGRQFVASRGISMTPPGGSDNGSGNDTPREVITLDLNEEADASEVGDVEVDELAGLTTLSVLNLAPVSSAEVWLDGELLGEAPDSFTGVEPGTYALEVRAPGHRAYADTVSLVAGQSIVVPSIQLVPSDVSLILHLSSNARMTSYFVDGQELASTEGRNESIRVELGQMVPGIDVYARGREPAFLELSNLSEGDDFTAAIDMRRVPNQRPAKWAMAAAGVVAVAVAIAFVPTLWDTGDLVDCIEFEDCPDTVTDEDREFADADFSRAQGLVGGFSGVGGALIISSALWGLLDRPESFTPGE